MEVFYRNNDKNVLHTLMIYSIQNSTDFSLTVLHILIDFYPRFYLYTGDQLQCLALKTAALCLHEIIVVCWWC